MRAAPDTITDLPADETEDNPGSLALLAIAFGALCAGVLVYLMARTTSPPAFIAALPWRDAFTLPALSRGLLALPWSGQLPSFFHAFAFTLASLAVVAPWRALYLPVCAGWLVLCIGGELLQGQTVKPLLDLATAQGTDSLPLLWQAHLSGVRDSADILASALGIGTAAAVLLCRQKPRCDKRTA